MLRNFLVTAIRFALKQKLTTVLNILGMAMGIAVSIILIMHVRYELSYDKHIPNVDRIYRITNNYFGENSRHWATTSTQIFNEITDFVPEVEEALRIRPIGNITFSFVKENREKISFEEAGGFNVDSTVFDVLGIKLLYGNNEDFYMDLNSLILTESMALKYFGTTDAVNRKLEAGSRIFTVRGIMPDCPKNSHLDYTYFLPYKSFKKRILDAGYSDLYYAKGWAGLYNYIKVKENINYDYLVERIDSFRVSYYTPVYENPDEILEDGKFVLQSVRDIHLHSNLEEEIKINGNITYIYIFIFSIIFILIVVASNYVNIATSLALKRMKEIGIKKINGSTPIQLKIQILGEAIITAVLGGVIAILIIDLILPYYNLLADQEFSFNHFIATKNFVFFILIVIVLGFLSGVYPAFFITKFNPIMALKGIKDPLSKSNKVRKVLLVFQFVVSIFMIFSTIGIYKQMLYFQNKNLGFDKDNLVSFNVTGALNDFVYNNSIAFKEELKKLPTVRNIAYSSNIPGDRLSVEGLMILNRDEELSNHALRVQRVCKDYVKTMGLNIIEGADFKQDLPQTSRFIIGKKTAEVLQLENPVGWQANPLFGPDGTIVGVIDDFHFASLHQPIEPIVLQYAMDNEMRGSVTNNVIIRLEPGSIKSSLTEIEGAIKAIVPDAIINFEFIDDYLNSLYVTETKMSNLFKAFTIFTILIACLGLFGITAYNAELKTKEIGIRKVLGASNMSIIRSQSMKFMAFIFISIVIALPLAYWFITNWMENFAYKANISIFSWLLAVLLSITIALLTVVYHAIRLARKNPVKVLKYE